LKLWSRYEFAKQKVVSWIEEKRRRRRHAFVLLLWKWVTCEYSFVL